MPGKTGIEKRGSNARRTPGRAFSRSWASERKASRHIGHELSSQGGLRASDNLPDPATSRAVAAIVVGMFDRLLGRHIDQVIEAKDTDHSMAIRMGTADPVVDETRFLIPDIFIF